MEESEGQEEDERAHGGIPPALTRLTAFPTTPVTEWV